MIGVTRDGRYWISIVYTSKTDVYHLKVRPYWGTVLSTCLGAFGKSVCVLTKVRHMHVSRCLQLWRRRLGLPAVCWYQVKLFHACGNAPLGCQLCDLVSISAVFCPSTSYLGIQFLDFERQSQKFLCFCRNCPWRHGGDCCRAHRTRLLGAIIIDSVVSCGRQDLCGVLVGIRVKIPMTVRRGLARVKHKSARYVLPWGKINNCYSRRGPWHMQLWQRDTLSPCVFAQWCKVQPPPVGIKKARCTSQYFAFQKRQRPYVRWVSCHILPGGSQLEYPARKIIQWKAEPESRCVEGQRRVR